MDQLIRTPGDVWWLMVDMACIASLVVTPAIIWGIQRVTGRGDW